MHLFPLSVCFVSFQLALILNSLIILYRLNHHHLSSFCIISIIIISCCHISSSQSLSSSHQFHHLNHYHLMLFHISSFQSSSSLHQSLLLALPIAVFIQELAFSQVLVMRLFFRPCQLLLLLQLMLRMNVFSSMRVCLCILDYIKFCRPCMLCFHLCTSFQLSCSSQLCELSFGLACFYLLLLMLRMNVFSSMRVCLCILDYLKLFNLKRLCQFISEDNFQDLTAEWCDVPCLISIA